MDTPATVTLEEVYEPCAVCQGAREAGGVICYFCHGEGGRRLGWRVPCATCGNTGAVRAQVPTPMGPVMTEPSYTESTCPDCQGWSKNIWMVVVARESPQHPGLFSIDRMYVEEPSLLSS